MSGLLRFLRTAMFGGAVFLVAMMGCSGTGTDIENDDDEPEDTTPPATVTDLRVVNPTPTTLTLRWTAPGDDGNEGFAVAYDLRMSGQPILPDNFTQAATIDLEGAPLPPGTTEEVVVRNLTEGETYHFAVLARDDAGLSGGLSNCAQGACLLERVVAVPDGALNQLLRETLQITAANIMLSDLLRLEELSGNERGIADLTGLEVAANLRIANLLGNEIADPSPLGNCIRLEGLNLTMNQLTDLSGLAELTGLVQLGVGQNQVRDISLVAGMTGLESLSIHANPLTDLSPLSGLAQLTAIDVSSLQLTDLSVLQGKTGLRFVSAVGNQIQDLSALGALPDLQELYLGYNQISDLSALVSNAGLGQGDVLHIQENPLSGTAVDVQIPALQARGVDVQY